MTNEPFFSFPASAVASDLGPLEVVLHLRLEHARKVAGPALAQLRPAAVLGGLGRHGLREVIGFFLDLGCEV